MYTVFRSKTLQIKSALKLINDDSHILSSKFQHEWNEIKYKNRPYIFIHLYK